ncbi:galactokinase [Lactococcus hodotermopsidis]|uniref:Galactokinase n=1 Tax=Pseudolactococcus hodotermopsidis TaxID=2709157 RepID=A0A6A0BH32_9LACT|nr:galactokinase [Lactococcus hodotermopsidis]GFH43097.1 galactokinase [Lactococcus hodotermopsidis]
MKKEVTEKFIDLFGDDNLSNYFSPGRINLIGEHTDYNGCYVFPAAISIGTFGVARKRTDSLVKVYSLNFDEIGIIEFSLDEPLENTANSHWGNFVKGYLFMLKQAGHEISQGFDLAIEGTIPNGSGLSSSASLELLVGTVANDLYDLGLDKLTLVQLGQKVENDFIGVNSGIMDQFAIGFGELGKAILLDTNTLKYEMVPAEFGDYKIVIMNTNKRRELADSKYNERRAQCEEALKRLQTKLDITALGQLSEEEFESNRCLINDEILEKRAKHAVYENGRTLKAKAALVAGDLVTFGQLLNASHESLKTDYEVTGIELDTLAETAQTLPGVLGARMTGAGFGGCGIALVNSAEIDNFTSAVNAVYLEKIGYAASFYVATIADGARKL